MKLVSYFDDVINEVESLDAIRKIDPKAKDKVDSKKLFQRFQGTIFIDINKAIKELRTQKEYKKLAIELTIDLKSPSAARRIFKMLAGYYNIYKGLEKVIFAQKAGKSIFFYFFVGGKLIELYIDEDNRFKDIGQVKIANIRFTEAGKNSDVAFSSVLNVGATQVLASVVKCVLYHRTANSNAYAYSFIGAASKEKDQPQEEISQRSRIYVSIIRMLARRMAMFLYTFKQFSNEKSISRYIIATKKLKEFEKLQGSSLKLFNASDEK